MRYQSLKSFEKHLSSAAPHHLCRHYLVEVSDDFERQKALSAILSFLPDSPIRLRGEANSIKDSIDAMQSMSLFGTSIVVIDEVEKFSKKDLEALSENLMSSSGYVLFGARSKVALLAIAVEKEGVVLDLLDEKPWDKEKRLSEELFAHAKNAGKQLLPDAALFLLERLGPDLALLESEIDQLICYVGDHSQILKDDIFAISPLSKTATLWQTAEEVVWEGGEFPGVDATSFHTLIPALRSQLHLGLCLATMIEERRPADEWHPFLPKLWPKTLEKRSSQAARLGSAYFQKGLEILFEVELLSRSHSNQYAALLELFHAR